MKIRVETSEGKSHAAGRTASFVIPTSRAATRRNLLSAGTIHTAGASRFLPGVAASNDKIFEIPCRIRKTPFDVFIERGKSEAEAVATRLKI
jgi:hypothetical protein